MTPQTPQQAATVRANKILTDMRLPDNTTEECLYIDQLRAVIEGEFLSGVEWQKAQEVEVLSINVLERIEGYLIEEDNVSASILLAEIDEYKKSTPRPVSPWVREAGGKVGSRKHYPCKVENSINGHISLSIVYRADENWDISYPFKVIEYLDETLLPNPNPQP